MASEFKEIIRRRFSTREKALEYIFESDEESVFDLASDLTSTLTPESVPANKSFSFVANSSLSGGRHPCTEVACRLGKLDEMASFAALYADEVYIQDPFEASVLKLTHDEELSALDRMDIYFGIEAYFYLEPLIERGLVKYAQSVVCLCDHHKRQLADPLHDSREEKEDRLYSELFNLLVENCRLTFDNTELNRSQSSRLLPASL